MATITLKGNPIELSGELPAVGSKAPRFVLTDGGLNDVTLANFRGKKKILSIVPSLDTGICAMSTVKFNQQAASLPKTVVLTISRDLPFAQKRFCEANQIQGVVTLSEFRDRKFGKKYGMEIKTGPMAGALGRAILVLDKANRVVYKELVPEIAQEPNYDAALAALNNI